MTPRTNRCLVLALGGALVAGAAVADTMVLDAVKVAVWQLPDKNETRSLFSGEVVEMTEGQELLLLTFSPKAKNPTGDRLYLESEWRVDDNGRGVVEISKPKEKGGVLVKAAKAGKAVVRYEILGDYDAKQKYQLHGQVKLEIAAARRPLTWPEAQVRFLYKGILMRKIDLEEAKPWIEMVDRDGYPGVLRAAYEIAATEESQSGIYAAGTDHGQRLEALYQYLLRREVADVPSSEWQARLRQLESRGITDVVMDFARSQEFREVHHYE